MIKWHEETLYSRFVAIVLFLGVLPMLGFYIGTVYETVFLQPQPPVSVESVQKTTHANSGAQDVSTVAEDLIKKHCGDVLGGPDFALCVQDAASEASDMEGTAYHKALDRVQANDSFDLVTRSTLSRSLKKAETVWQEYVSVECAAEQLTFTGGTDFNSAADGCYIGEAMRRIDTLENSF